MFTVHRFYDVPGPTLGESVEIGTAETVDELHDLLRDITGKFQVTGANAGAPVRLDLEAYIGDDRAFIEQIVQATEGNGPAELVSL